MLKKQFFANYQGVTKYRLDSKYAILKTKTMSYNIIYECIMYKVKMPQETQVHCIY